MIKYNHLFSVTYYDGNDGPFVLEGANAEGLRRLVAAELTAEETFGEVYGLDVLAANIAGVNEDVEKGRISAPTTIEDYANAVLKEYRTNLSAIPPEALRNLVRSYRQNQERINAAPAVVGDAPIRDGNARKGASRV